ncbi:putative Rtf2 RING-finger [Monocercomonoides exilis]|uniref:putative Rtf2 RING-finger n=1 Tax=Monocercomonoides exilis TaxID=2049356 RepID=UPI003559F095|nr:putative Rtf2 RING-finger [Monocercomonoides exilis]|eukprot:MONOS_9047.1-p1 / transcript=MONOS_9047.1 / gene=MONOS_9047 / organism=Monocercomonoides_exilis_PA203 / gene_product=DUF602-domain-containing protein / transcript_product=DUF602-domain-containing protein / location=Mono_scaffold00360:14460-15332(-) / protein_length=271 / sequence_SO=supercontig / SO=protein_coding / is_pseudo=false
MGGDGGSFVHRTELAKTKKEEKPLEYYTQYGEHFFSCALTQSPLSEPIVADSFGNLFSKEHFIQEWIARKKEVKRLFPYIKNPLKDLIELHFTPNKSYTKTVITIPSHGESGPWICPLKNEIEVNGKQRFSYFSPCGHVISDIAICTFILEKTSLDKYHSHAYSLPKEASCPVCSSIISSIIPINPPKEELLIQRPEIKNSNTRPSIEVAHESITSSSSSATPGKEEEKIEELFQAKPTKSKPKSTLTTSRKVILKEQQLSDVKDDDKKVE